MQLHHLAPFLLLLPHISPAPQGQAADTLITAAQDGDLDRVRRLVTESDTPGVNMRDNLARTPLIFAASFGDPAIVQELLAAGAEVNSQDTYGWSPLHWAADTNHLAALRALMEQGASVDLQDTEGWTALHWAAYRGNLEVVQELVTRNATVGLVTRMDRNTKKRYTAWDLASMYGQSEVAEFLQRQQEQ